LKSQTVYRPDFGRAPPSLRQADRPFLILIDARFSP